MAYKFNPFTGTLQSVISSEFSSTGGIKTSNYAANPGEEILCDTTGGGFTVTLPVSGRVKVIDVAGTSFDTGFGAVGQHLTLVPQVGQTINGEAALELDVGLTAITLWLVDTDWVVIDLDGAAFRELDWGDITNKPSVVETTGDQTISGTKTFSTALILPNNSRINGVEHFYQITKPLTRGDSSTLVAGDRWWKSDDGTEWFWNGTYWLSKPFTIGNGIGQTDMEWRIGEDLRGFYLHSIVAKGRTAVDPPNWDADNYWKCNFIFGGRVMNDLAVINSTIGYIGGPDLHYYRLFTIEQAAIPTFPSVGGSNIFISQIRQTGSPTGAGGGSSSLSYFFKISYIFI